jgi:hypothetical protein
MDAMGEPQAPSVHVISRAQRALALLLGVSAALLPIAADAHVKWFARYEVAEQPQPLVTLVSGTYALLFAAALVALWVTCRLEPSRLGAACVRLLDRAGAGLRPRSEDLLRATTAAFFIAIWVKGDVILTPELRTESMWIPWLQAGIAAGMFSRATLIPAALGIVVLFAYGVLSYGAFHMMDYPIFLGLAAYLAMSNQRMSVVELRPVDVARWGTAVTLMWASVEKWAYPAWTFPVLQAHPGLAMGLEPSFYMTAAGVIEFTLAFALVWTPLARRLSAIVLAIMFVGAVFEFGKTDAIGHLPIVAILLTIAVDNKPTREWRPALAPMAGCAGLIALVTAYYGAHALILA